MQQAPVRFRLLSDFPKFPRQMVSLLGSKVSDTTMAQVSRQMVSALGFDVTDPLAMGSCHVDASFELLSDKLAISECESAWSKGSRQVTVMLLTTHESTGLFPSMK